MEIQEKFTVSLTEQSVKEIVASYLQGKGYNAKPENVSFDVVPAQEACPIGRLMGCSVEMEGSPWRKD